MRAPATTVIKPLYGSPEVTYQEMLVAIKQAKASNL